MINGADTNEVQLVTLYKKKSIGMDYTETLKLYKTAYN